MRCCVPLCEEDSVLHKFPTANEKQCHVWLARIGDRELVKKELEELQRYYGVCDLHFEPSCHDSDSDELIPGALPTLHLPGSRSEEYVGCYAMDFSQDNTESPEALDVIVEGLRDSTHVVNLHVDSDVEAEDVVRRYSYDQMEIRDESEITIHRPEDIEIVTRYAMKCEQESDDEIILKYPNDDDVIKRYSAGAGHSPIGRRVGVCDKGSSTEDCILEECAGGFPEMDLSANISVAGGCVPSSVDQSGAGDSGVRGLMREPAHSPIRPKPSSIRRESDSEMSESNEDSMSDHDVSEHPSDDDEEEGIHRDPGELNSVSEEFEDSCYESVDADEALRALMKPSCSSPRNHSITVYNLCCDKKFLSSISIDSPKKDPLPTRGMTRRAFLHDLVMNAPLSNSFQGVGDSKRNPFTGKKSRNKNKSKLSSRSDNVLSVIHSLEKLAQNVETQCIEARRSLRKNCSHSNILRTGAKLKGEVTPLLNSQLSLIKKIRTNVP